MNVKQFLIDAKARISDPAHWTQGQAKRITTDADGVFKAQFCSIGALQEQARYRLDGRPYPVAILELRKHTGTLGIVNFNDHSSHAAVMAMWDRTIAGCER